MNKFSVVSLQEQNKCGMVSLVSAWFETRKESWTGIFNMILILLQVKTLTTLLPGYIIMIFIQECYYYVPSVS